VFKGAIVDTGRSTSTFIEDVFREIEASGHRVMTSEFTLYHVEHGKFAEVWDLTDMDAVMRQIRQGERH
jgi:predicted ester cyclase